MPDDLEKQAIIGVGTAMVTPFLPDGKVDYSTLERFVTFQIEQGVNFLVPCGTTGETPTLTIAEQDEVVERTLGLCKGRIPVVAGCTSNNTREVVERGKQLVKLGVRYVLSASPYYNKPTQEGIYQHFKALREETNLEIMAYSVQGRTASNIASQTVERMVAENIIFALKEASGSILQIQEICQRCGDSLIVLSGDDALVQPLMAVGGKGVVSVASNVVPKAMREWVDCMLERDFVHARALLKPLLPLFDACFVESNPIPVKAGADILGLMENHHRLPMIPAQPDTVEQMKHTLSPFMS